MQQLDIQHLDATQRLNRLVPILKEFKKVRSELLNCLEDNGKSGYDWSRTDISEMSEEVVEDLCTKIGKQIYEAINKNT